MARGTKAVKQESTRKSSNPSESKGMKKKKASQDSEIPQAIHTVNVEWDGTLTWSLINAIQEDEMIQKGLFPPVGSNASTQKGGGKPKTEFQFMLATKLFATHPTYGSAFNEAKTAQERQQWQTKIKNRLKTLTTQTREHIEQMGTTGAGIERAADIEGETALSKTWEAVQQVSPWFFEMRDLIGQRPNLVPTGLGNSQTVIDSSLLLGGTSDLNSEPLTGPDATGDTINIPSHVASMTDAEHGHRSVSSSDSDEDSNLPETLSQIHIPKKRKQPILTVHVDEPAVKREVKQEAGMSTPDSRTKKKMKGSIADKFTAAAIAEEGTAQRHLDLKMVKAKTARDVKVQKLKSQAEVKMASLKFKQERASERARQDHEFRMAQLGATRHGAGLTFTTPSTSGISSSFPDASSGHGGFPALTSSENLSGHSTPYSFTTNLNDPNLSFHDYSSTA